jgi:molybdate transport system ATP-binding protein
MSSLHLRAVIPQRGIDVTLDVAAGETVALTGPNGAGKSSILGVIAGLLRPDEGEVRLGDRILDRTPPHARGIALLAQDPLLFPHLSVLANVAFAPRARGVHRRQANELATRHLTEVGAEMLAGRRPTEISGGQAQRVAVARALAADPELLLLDEPTVGLDPQSARDLRDRVREMRTQGRTVLLTTHYMEEADQLCDRIAIIDHGHIVALDTPGALKRTIAATEVVRLEVQGAAASDPGLVARLGRVGSVARQERLNGVLSLTIHCRSARDLVPAAFDAARAEGATIDHVEVVAVTLEDVFLALTGRELRE